MRRLSTALVLACLAAALPHSPAYAAPATSAVISWSMVPMSKDSNKDGFIDGDGGVPAKGALSLAPSPNYVGAGNGIAQPNERLIDGALSWYLDDSGYPVQLNACASAGSRYSWHLVGAGIDRTLPARALGKHTCKSTVLLPEGEVEATLIVTRGSTKATATTTLAVRNLLLVAFGDSYASGEGNPRNVDAWIAEGTLLGEFTPYWDDVKCHRSVHGAPAQAALMLEQSSPRTSVTLVDVTCSGATVDAGVLGPQPSAGQTTSQIERARRIIGSRPIDLVTISVGGNDIGFGNVLLACATNADCPTSKPTQPPLRGFPTVQDGIQATTGELLPAYTRIAACLGGSACDLRGPGSKSALPLASGAKILPTMYPDITRDSNGQPCNYLTFTSENMAWARATILDPATTGTYGYRSSTGTDLGLSVGNGTLNGQIARTDTLGWSPVAGSWGASGESLIGHGVCAGPQAWAFGLTGLSGLPQGSFHPNPTGQVAIAKALAAAAS